MATIPNNYRILKYTALQGQDQFIIDWPYDDVEDVYFRINNSLDVKLSGEYDILGGMLRLNQSLNAGAKVVIYRNKQAEQALEFITGGAVTQKMLQENNNDIFFILQDILKNYLNLTDSDQVIDFINNDILPLLPDATEQQRGLIKIATTDETLTFEGDGKAVTPEKLGDFYDNYTASVNIKGFVTLSNYGELTDFNSNNNVTSNNVITSSLLKTFYLNYKANTSRNGFIQLASEEETIEGENLEKAITPYTLKKALEDAGIGGGGGTDIEDLPVGTIMILNPDLPSDKWLICNGDYFDGTLYPELSSLTGYSPFTQIYGIDYAVSQTNQLGDGAILLRKTDNGFVYKNRPYGYKTKLALNYNNTGNGSSFYNINTSNPSQIVFENMNYPDSEFGITNTIEGRNNFSDESFRIENVIFNCDSNLSPGIYLLHLKTSTGYTGTAKLFNLFNQTSIDITGIEGQAVEKHFNPTLNKFVITTRNYTGGVYYMNIYTLGINETAATLVYQTTNNQFMMTPFTGNRASTLQGATGKKQYNYNLNSSNFINGGNNYLDGKYYFFDLFNKQIFSIDENTWNKTILYTTTGIFQWLTSDEGVNILNGITVGTNGTLGRQASIIFGNGHGFINNRKEFIFIDSYSLQNKQLTVKKTTDFITYQEIMVTQWDGIDFSGSTSQFKNVALLDNISFINGFTVLRPTDFEPTTKPMTIFYSFFPPSPMELNQEWSETSNWNNIGTVLGNKLLKEGYSNTLGVSYDLSTITGGTKTPMFYPDNENKFAYYLKAKP